MILKIPQKKERIFVLDKRIELRVDQLSFTFKFENEEVNSIEHSQRCKSMIRKIINEFYLMDIFVSCEDLKGRNGYSDGKRFVINNSEMMSFAYSKTMQNMGLFFELRATGFEHLLAVTGLSFSGFMEKLNDLTERESFPGSWKMTRYDVAADLFNYGISLNKINNKILKESLKFKQLSRRGDGTKRNYIDRVLNLDERVKHVGTGQNIETLYVGTRQGKSAFLRFYNKFIDVIDKGKKQEEDCYSNDWYRYEIELKFDSTSGTSFFQAVSKVKTEEEFKAFNATQIIDNYRLVTKQGNDVPFIADIAKIARNGEFGFISPNESRTFDLESSKEYFISGKSGLQSLLYRIRMTEGRDAVIDYLSDIMYYQDEHYRPTEKDSLYLRHFDNSHNTFSERK